MKVGVVYTAIKYVDIDDINFPLVTDYNYHLSDGDRRYIGAVEKIKLLKECEDKVGVKCNITRVFDDETWETYYKEED